VWVLSSGQQNPDSIVNNKTMVQAYEKTLTSASFQEYIWLCRTTLSRLIRNKKKKKRVSISFLTATLHIIISHSLLYSAVNISLVLESKLTLLMKCVGHGKAKYMWLILKTIKSKEREHHFNLPLNIIPNLSI